MVIYDESIFNTLAVPNMKTLPLVRVFYLNSIRADPIYKRHFPLGHSPTNNIY